MNKTPENHSPKESSRLECLKCHKIFLYKIGYFKHIQKHENKKTDFKTIPVNSLDKNETKNNENVFVKNGKTDVMIHDKSSEKSYCCSYCAKNISSLGNLKKHERIHTGEKPFQCNYCAKSFAESGCLKTHKRIHTAEKPFQCKTCSKSFNTSSNLKNHEKLHTGEKPFECDICARRFSTSLG